VKMAGTSALERSVSQVLDSQGVAVLSTRGEEYPHTCLVAFVASEDLTTIAFATSRRSRKYDNIRKDGKASILVDTRNNVPDDFHKASVVSAQGSIEELAGAQAAQMERLYLVRHPYLENFLGDPTTALMGMKVASYALVSRFQNVLILDMDRGPSG